MARTEAARARSFTKCMSARLRRKGPGRRRRNNLPELAQNWNHRDRDDADRGFSRRISAGAMTASISSRRPVSTERRTICALHRSRALVRRGRHSRCRLQPLRPGRKLSARFLRRLSSPIATRTTGAIRSISTDQTPDRCANFSSPTAATGSMNFISMAFASTPRKAFVDQSDEYIVGAIGRAARARRRRAFDHSGRGERTAGSQAGSAAQRRRRRSRRALE